MQTTKSLHDQENAPRGLRTPAAATLRLTHATRACTDNTQNIHKHHQHHPPPKMTMLPYEIAYTDYSTVYNALSFVMASMMASTVRRGPWTGLCA